MRRRGAALTQLLVGTVIMGVVMTVVLQGTVSLWRMQSFSTGYPAVQDDARETATRIADALRGATLCTATDSGCTVDAAVESTSPTGLTVYKRNLDGSLSEITYGVSGGNFTQATGSVSKGNLATTTFASNLGLTLTYYTASSYYSNGLVAYVPTSATTPNLVAVGIVTTAGQADYTARFETIIRLRNSPKP